MAMKEGYVKPFNLSNVNTVPEIAGIYAIYDMDAGGEIAYIGMSQGTPNSTIYSRLKAHVNCTRNGSKVIRELIANGHELWFSFTSSDNPSGAEAAEIERLHPAGNKRREMKKLEDFYVGSDSSDK
jgi:hypothetical protein